MPQLLGSLRGRALLTTLPHEDTANLDDTNASKEEVDGGEPIAESVEVANIRSRLKSVQDVSGLDDQAPASPDGSGGHQGGVLGEGEFLGRAVEVGDTGDDQSPLL